MRNRINPRQRCHAGWLSGGQLWIQQSDFASRSLVAASHFDVRFRIADQSEGLCFATGARCGGNRDHRQHVCGCFANAMVVMDTSTA